MVFVDGRKKKLYFATSEDDIRFCHRGFGMTIRPVKNK